MFAITASPVLFAKTDDFKKVGKKIQKQRKGELDKIKDKLGDIARTERKRVEEIFKEHQDIFKKKDKTKTRPKSIDLYEK
jgi:CO dehydrogenase/acetyl-CoA synthase beta subunit